MKQTSALKKVARPISCTEFNLYGKVISDIDLTPVIQVLVQEITPPASRVEYIKNHATLMTTSTVQTLQQRIYGELAVQAGYVCGQHRSQDGFEYHQGSEVIIAASDLLLLLGKREQMQDNTFDARLAEAFYVPANSAIELYSTTLHHCPLSINNAPFMAAIILPAGTNEELDKVQPGSALIKRNTWFIAHESFKDSPAPFLLGPHLTVDNIVLQ